MHKVWTLVIDIFIGILIIFVSVTIYFGIRTETVMKSMYKSISEEFVSTTKRNGVTTLGDYEDYMERMGTGNSLFDISFEHRYKIIEPEYRFKTLEEIIDEQNKAYPGSNDYHYREVITERPHVDDPINDGNLNTETNESILENAVDTPADPSHVHSDDCYMGHRHSRSGCRYNSGHSHSSSCFHSHSSSCYTTCSGGGYTQSISTSSHYCGGTMTTYARYCSSCGNHIYSVLTCSGYKPSDPNNICGGGGQYPAGSHARTLTCSISTSSPICGRSESSGGWNCGISQDTTLDCSYLVMSLTPTHSIQTIYINVPLITTAVATYKNGSTKVVVCTTDFSTSTIVKDRSVILKYNYMIDGVSHSKTCTIKVTVIPRNASCSKGHIYNLNDDGTDPGCPYCRAWIDSLRIINPTTSPITITIGTTLQDNNVTLLVTYMDGHTEEVSSGYIDNLDRAYLGRQTVTIGYKGASITVVVTTVRATMTCDICGYIYELYPDGTNPGCPRCIQKTPVFTGNILEYDYLKNTEEILEELYAKGKYSFNVDDVFSIAVSNKSTNVARQLLRKIYPSLTDRWFTMNKSGHVMSK